MRQRYALQAISDEQRLALESYIRGEVQLNEGWALAKLVINRRSVHATFRLAHWQPGMVWSPDATVSVSCERRSDEVRCILDEQL